MHQKSIFRFRQDLRIHDNHGLIQAIQNSKEILPIFIFDTNILKHCPAKDPRLGFLIDAVNKLDEELQSRGSKLYVFQGDPIQIIKDLIKNEQIEALYANRSYGHGSIGRDKIVGEYCRGHGIAFETCSDFLLVEPNQIEQRKVFTPFSKLWYKYLEANPIQILDAPKRIQTIQISDYAGIQKVTSAIDAGENIYRPINFAQNRIETFAFDHYEDTRNLTFLDGTSKLSPYIRFGLLSVRELYLKIKNNQTYCNELARREFRQHIHYYFPETRVLEFQEKKRNIKRGQLEGKNTELFQKRCDGQTGYPIVDAGMKQLKQENRMHGRVRMIVASFLTKDLLLDRRLGEAHFARYLLDYDTNVNIGNWQWSASVGADPKPLRIFNPILQSQRFDPQAEYILNYIPELKGQDIKAIHDPLSYDLNYCKPIVNHYENSKLAKQMYYESYSINNKS